MISINADDLSVQERQNYLTSGIGPRPIALVSSISEEGIPNLAPFSFFNAFGANPPTVAFSPARRGRDGSLKDTYYNVKANKECAIAMVSYDMVEQVSLASSEYDEEVNEFIKSGLTAVASTKIKPAGIAEAPIWFECIVKDIIHTGDQNGAGNIVICEIVVFHINEDVIVNNKIDPNKADIVGRFGGNDYIRASGSAVFDVAKPTSKGMGFDNLPDFILESKILTANNLARLANMETKPSHEEVSNYYSNIDDVEFSEDTFNKALENKDVSVMLEQIVASKRDLPEKFSEYIEQTAKIQIESGHAHFAWLTLFLNYLE
jgi:flavin reductase (DIM6/NTAB) family NADH-FMN oxidoreductase RutF